MSLDFLWDERIWLPENVHWSDLEPRVVNGTFVHFPQFGDLKYSILAGAILLLVRILIECFFLLPIGVLGGWIQLRPRQTTLDVCLRHLNFGFAGKSKFKRVSETGWRFIYYTTIWCTGLYLLRGEPQWLDLDESWRNYPFHPLSNKIWYYYIIQAGFYWSLLFSAFTIDVRRSDFWEMAAHHAITILLLSMSFTINFIRCGTMVLICHDTADILLELGKLMRYARWEKCLTVTFCIFLVTWISSRIFYFPLVIIRSVLIAAPDMIQQNYRWINIFQRPIIPRLFLLMLCILVCLHFFWTIVLFKVAYKSTQEGESLDDIREDSSSGDEEETITDKKTE